MEKGKKGFFNFFLTNQAKEMLFMVRDLSNMLWKMTGIKAREPDGKWDGSKMEKEKRYKSKYNITNTSTTYCFSQHILVAE